MGEERAMTDGGAGGEGRPPSAIEVRGMTREAFLVRASLATATVYGAGALAPVVRPALAQRGAAVGDLNILNFALTLQLVEQSLYDEARVTGTLGGEAGALRDELARNEADHVAALRALVVKLRGKPVSPPDVSFGGAIAGRSGFLELAQTIEDTVVAALNGMAPDIVSKEVIEGLGSLAQVEARHSALIRMVRGEDPAPKAFEDTLSIPQARDRLSPWVPEFGG
jgi:hypothetical protein